MEEKHKNGCNILIMIFTNLEKYVYSKKCLKQRRQPPPLPPAKSKVFSRQKSRLATAVWFVIEYTYPADNYKSNKTFHLS